MGGATSKPSSGVASLFTLVDVTSVAYRHDVKRKKTFWLFQNYVKKDLMSNSM